MDMGGKAGFTPSAVVGGALPKIFCDLDGVLCDFDRGVEKIFQATPDQLNRQTMWRGLATTDGFCESPPTEGYLA